MELDVKINVTMRIYDGTPEDVVTALARYPNTFDLLNGGEAEIIHAEIAE